MISSEVKIEPVGPFARRAALRLMARGVGSGAAGQAETLARLYRDTRGADGAVFWRARRRRRCVAAAMVVPNPGRFGMLLYSSPGSDGVDASALAMLLRRVSAEACRRGLVFVQSLVLPAAGDEAAALESAGLVKLANLLYMRLNLLGPPPPDDSPRPRESSEAPWCPGQLTWRSYDQYDESDLCSTIAATYVGSLDCPGLSGRRVMSDVVAGHKASGTFRPSCWSLVAFDGRAAGCILVNGSTSPRAAEVVYVGVLPEFRGRRLGRAMLDRAVMQARERKDYAMNLAVDSRNAHAMRMYDSAGFKQVFSRLAYISPPDRQPDTTGVEKM